MADATIKLLALCTLTKCGRRPAVKRGDEFDASPEVARQLVLDGRAKAIGAKSKTKVA